MQRVILPLTMQKYRAAFAMIRRHAIDDQPRAPALGDYELQLGRQGIY